MQLIWISHKGLPEPSISYSLEKQRGVTWCASYGF